MSLRKTLTYFPATVPDSTFKDKPNLHKYTAKQETRPKSQAKSTTEPSNIDKNSATNHNKPFLINTENPQIQALKLTKTPTRLPKTISSKLAKKISCKISMNMIIKRETSKSINFPNATTNKTINQIYLKIPHTSPKKRSINLQTHGAMTAAIMSKKIKPTKKNATPPNLVHNSNTLSLCWSKTTRTSSTNSE